MKRAATDLSTGLACVFACALYAAVLVGGVTALAVVSVRVPEGTDCVVDERCIVSFEIAMQRNLFLSGFFTTPEGEVYVVHIQTEQGGYERMVLAPSEVELAYDAEGAGEARLEAVMVVERGRDELSSFDGLVRWEEDYESADEQVPALHLTEEMAAKL